MAKKEGEKDRYKYVEQKGDGKRDKNNDTYREKQIKRVIERKQINRLNRER